jgi:hypothetical protein
LLPKWSIQTIFHSNHIACTNDTFCAFSNQIVFLPFIGILYKVLFYQANNQHVTREQQIQLSEDTPPNDVPVEKYMSFKNVKREQKQRYGQQPKNNIDLAYRVAYLDKGFLTVENNYNVLGNKQTTGGIKSGIIVTLVTVHNSGYRKDISPNSNFATKCPTKWKNYTPVSPRVLVSWCRIRCFVTQLDLFSTCKKASYSWWKFVVRNKLIFFLFCIALKFLTLDHHRQLF